MSAQVYASPFIEEKKELPPTPKVDQETQTLKKNFIAPPIPSAFQPLINQPVMQQKDKETKWVIKGKIGNEIIVKNKEGEMLLVKEGSSIDGCIIQYPRLFCPLNAPEIRLLAVNHTNKTAMFRINSKTVMGKEGDTIEGLKIKNIGSKSILNDSNGMEIIVKLENFTAN